MEEAARVEGGRHCILSRPHGTEVEALIDILTPRLRGGYDPTCQQRWGAVFAFLPPGPDA